MRRRQRTLAGVKRAGRRTGGSGVLAAGRGWRRRGAGGGHRTIRGILRACRGKGSSVSGTGAPGRRPAPGGPRARVCSAPAPAVASELPSMTDA